MQHKGYRIECLDSKSFDELPYNSVSESLGLCDMNSKVVYYRDTGNPILDIFTVAHEIDHVENGDCGEHEDPNQPGVYYKKASSWILPAVAAASFLIPGVGPAIGGALGSMGAAGGGALTSMGLGGLSSALAPIGAALSGAGASFAGAGSATQAALGGLLGGGGSAASNAGYAANAGKIGSSMGGFGLGSGTGAGSAAASASAYGGGGGGIGSLIGDTLKGYTQSSIVGSLMNKNKKTNEFPDYMNSFNNQPSQPQIMQNQNNQSPNVVQVGGRGRGMSGSIRSDQELARTALGRNKGFYAGRGGF